VGSLGDWWQRQGDPLLAELIAAAQDVSPSVAQAQARMASARANQAAAKAALLPSLSAQASASRGVSQSGVPLASTVQGGLQASWELDLVGANRAVSRRRNRRSKAARPSGTMPGCRSQPRWPTCSTASVIASSNWQYPRCRFAPGNRASDRAISAKAGFVAPSVAAMARASAAEANSRVTQQSGACALDLKGLVALTALPEPDLKENWL
jgi:multidrug efflux system outer membrane protein